MIQSVIVIVVLILAVAYALHRFYRVIRHGPSCDCCSNDCHKCKQRQSNNPNTI